MPVEFSIDREGRFAYTGDFEKDFISAVDFIRDVPGLRAWADNGPMSLVQSAIRARRRIKLRLELGYAKHGLSYLLALRDRKKLTVMDDTKTWQRYVTRPTAQRKNYMKINGVKARKKRTEGR